MAITLGRVVIAGIAKDIAVGAIASGVMAAATRLGEKVVDNLLEPKPVINIPVLTDQILQELSTREVPTEEPEDPDLIHITIEEPT